MSAVDSKLQLTNQAIIVPIENLLDSMDAPSERLAECALELLSKRDCQSPYHDEWLQVEVDLLYPYPIQINEHPSGFTICVKMQGFCFVEVKVGVGQHHLIL